MKEADAKTVAKIYAQVFGTENGEKVLQDFQDGIEVQSFTGDPYKTAFNEGYRHCLRTIMSLVRAGKDPDAFQEKAQTEEE